MKDFQVSLCFVTLSGNIVQTTGGEKGLPMVSTHVVRVERHKPNLFYCPASVLPFLPTGGADGLCPVNFVPVYGRVCSLRSGP